MSLQHLPFQAISEQDLARLVVDNIEESKVIEYKKALSLVSDGDKQEFLSDVTALANTDGGDLVIGLRAEKGVAHELIGLRNFVPDEVIGRVENLLRDSIQPRLTGVELRAFLLANGNHAFLIRVPRSLSAPHMMRHQGVTRFCGRNTNGKYDLDVHELRSAFLANETYADRLRSFRVDRINRLVSGSGCVPLSGKHITVLHVLPVLGARTDTRLTTSDFNLILGEDQPRPIRASVGTAGFNFDGLLFTAAIPQRGIYSYVQVMRNGFLESVDASALEPGDPPRAGHLPLKRIDGIGWEAPMVNVLPRYFKALSILGLPPPYAVSISLLHVRGYEMAVAGPYQSLGARLIDRDHLLTDEVLIESVAVDPGRILRPLFDQVWNACGWRGSINYTPEGEWRGRE